MFKTILLAIVLYVLSINAALAQNYVVNVHGIVCEFCSFGVAKKIRKLSFLDTSQYNEGVKVDIEKQMVFFAVRDGSILDKTALFKAIKSGGYEPVDIWLIGESGERKKVE